MGHAGPQRHSGNQTTECPRIPGRFKTKTKEYLDGGKTSERCPALAPSKDRKPAWACGLRPGASNQEGLPHIPNPPPASVAGEICTKNSILVKSDDEAKLSRKLQAYPHLTEERLTYYAAGRNAVERSNSQIKAAYKMAFASSGRRGLKGKANMALLGAFMVAAHNLDLITTWAEMAERGESGDIVGAPKKNQRGERLPRCRRPNPDFVAMLDDLGGPVIQVDPETGEIIEQPGASPDSS